MENDIHISASCVMDYSFPTCPSRMFHKEKTLDLIRLLNGWCEMDHGITPKGLLWTLASKTGINHA